MLYISYELAPPWAIGLNETMEMSDDVFNKLKPDINKILQSSGCDLFHVDYDVKLICYSIPDNNDISWLIFKYDDILYRIMSNREGMS